jgi:mono/diheme cytochrome c family protein/uncharacterized cupredoxin-like copper-binding protein
MSQEDGGSQLTPREPGDTGETSSPLIPVDGDSRDVERFSAGPQARSVQLTEERSAQIVRQSANARSVVFLAILVIALFIPVYWFYESGIPAIGGEGRLAAEADVQYVTDVSRGYELYIANCAECHGAEGQGGIGPRLNDQAKLYNALTPAGEPGSGHLNPNYIDNVLTVGGRYVCGDPNSLMAAWLEPNGPLNYRQVEELIAWLTASNEVIFEHEPASHGEGEAVEPEVVAGWRDPNWQPGPEDTPPPACWKNPSGVIGGGAPVASPAPVDAVASTAPVAGGSSDAPRVVRLEATSSLQFTDESGAVVTQIAVVPGETIEFVVNNSAGFDHNFWIGTPDVLSVPNAETDVGIPTWQSGEQTVTWTVPEDGGALQFACTVPGHYTTMHADIVIQG